MARRSGERSNYFFIPIDDMNLQEEFAAVVRQVESLRARAGESAREGEELFQSLLSQSFGQTELRILKWTNL